MDSDEDPWLRLPEVARQLGLCRESARKLVISGELRGQRYRRRGVWQVRQSWLDAYTARHDALSPESAPNPEATPCA